ncbi:MAG: hypothetical protein M1821_005560, partial [Bathelium mastoideum]
TYRFSHVTHCLDGIRQTIMCDADDTPRYTTNDGNPTSGVGQIRMCRSWEAMERWAVQNSACWSYVDPSNWDTDMIRRYKYCPPESPYWEKVRDYFGDSTLGNESLKTSYDMGWGKSIDV